MKRIINIICLLGTLFLFSFTASAYDTIWVLGEMGLDGENENPDQQIGFRPDKGIKMSTADGNIYSAEIHFWNIAGSATHNFGFCKSEQLADSYTNWNAIASSRFGAAVANTKLANGNTYSVGEAGASKENFFVAPTGTWKLELNLSAKTLKVLKIEPVWLLGEFSGPCTENPNDMEGFRPDKGVKMFTPDGVNYLARVRFTNPVGDRYHNFGFCFSYKLADDFANWDAIANYRRGAASPNTYITPGSWQNLGALGSSKENFFKAETGTYTIIVNINEWIVYTQREEEPYWDTYCDTWVGQDDLGRQIDFYETTGNERRKNKDVGIFYYLIHGYHGTKGDPIYDNTEIIKANPTNPQFGPEGKEHWWGKPWLGYYNNLDVFAHEKHLQMLTDAGVDFLFFDVSNGFTYDAALKALFQAIDNRTAAGLKSPKLTFLINAGAANLVRHFYNNYYTKPEYSDYWYYYQGKPLILADKSACSELSSTILNYFTFRHSWAWMDQSSPNRWSWLDNAPQNAGWSYINGVKTIEQMTVSTAQHASTKIGKSYFQGSQPALNSEALTDRTPYGDYFCEQMFYALHTDPPVIMFTQFNEWVATRFILNSSSNLSECRPNGSPVVGESSFIDTYNAEFNRDIEPSTHPLIRDNYLCQFTSYVRQFKGSRQIPVPNKPYTIYSDQPMSQWDAVYPEFRDDIGDITHRNTLGCQDVYPMVNETGRNDIVSAKVAKDALRYFFYVKCASDISDFATSDNWMTLFLNTDCNYGTGWKGYDYAVMKVDGEYWIVRNDSNLWKWAKVAQVNPIIDGAEMHFAVGRDVIGHMGDADFDFKWADNYPDNPDILDFIDKGDAAPNGRFNYRYKGSQLQSPVASVSELRSDLASVRIYKSSGNILNIQSDDKADVVIYNLQGNIVNRLTVQGTSQITIPTGALIVKATTDSGSKTVKLM